MFQTNVIFLPAGNHGIGKEKLPLQKMVSQKISGYGPAFTTKWSIKKTSVQSVI